ADGLTPQRLTAVLRAADAGDLTEQMALFEQMEEKDPHLFSVANTRRLAVTGLPWRIVSGGGGRAWGRVGACARARARRFLPRGAARHRTIRRSAAASVAGGGAKCRCGRAGVGAGR